MIATGCLVNETLSPLEDNGFTVIDFTRDKMEFRQFGWKMGRKADEIDTLEPIHRFTLAR